MFNIALLVMVLVGVSISIKLALWIQLIIVIAGMIFANSDWVRKWEIGALLWIGLVYFMFAGMVIGDLIYLFKYQPNFSETTVLEIIKWPFKP